MMRDQDYMPIYKKIKEQILNDIAKGIYGPGDMLPKQTEFADAYGVSRVTVREAFNELKLRGILVSKKGKGTFVADNVSNFYGAKRSCGLSRNAAVDAHVVHSKLLEMKVLLPPKHVAEALHIPETDEVLYIKRLRYINQLCVAVENAYLQYKFVKDIDFSHIKCESSSLYKILQEKGGIQFKCADEEIHAVLADNQLAEWFNIEYLDPLLYVKRTTITINGVRLEYCDNYERSDIYGLKVRTISL